MLGSQLESKTYCLVFIFLWNYWHFRALQITQALSTVCILRHRCVSEIEPHPHFYPREKSFSVETRRKEHIEDENFAISQSHSLLYWYLNMLSVFCSRLQIQSYFLSLCCNIMCKYPTKHYDVTPVSNNIQILKNPP